MVTQVMLLSLSVYFTTSHEKQACFKPHVCLKIVLDVELMRLSCCVC